MDELDFVPIGEQLGKGVALPVADFHQKPALGLQHMPRLRNEAPVDVESSRAGVEGGARLEVADLGFEHFGFGDVGRVRDDRVEAFAYNRAEQIGFEKADAAGQLVAFGILLRDAQGGGGIVERRHGGLREIVGDRDGDGSRAGAYVGDAQRLVVRDALQQRFDEVLGFRARDEDVGAEAEREAIEFLFAGDVLDGLVPHAPREPLVVKGVLFGCQLRVRIREQKGAILTYGAEQEEFGVTLPGGEVCEACGSVGEGGGQGHSFAKWARVHFLIFSSFRSISLSCLSFLFCRSLYVIDMA